MTRVSASDATPGRADTPDRLLLQALRDIGLIQPGDPLATIIIDAAARDNIVLSDATVLVIAQKIVSKAEGRMVPLASVSPSGRALRLARETAKDARLVQLILDESTDIVRVGHNVIVVEHRLGFVMANAGIDQSNVAVADGTAVALLLPLDPDQSAARIRADIGKATGQRPAVIINDSIGRAWRNGTVGHALGVAGITPLLDLRGTEDLFGRELQVTEVALADELAAAASILMGQGDQGKPVVVIDGCTAHHFLNGAGVQALLRTRERDLFR